MKYSFVNISIIFIVTNLLNTNFICKRNNYNNSFFTFIVASDDIQTKLLSSSSFSAPIDNEQLLLLSSNDKFDKNLLSTNKASLNSDLSSISNVQQTQTIHFNNTTETTSKSNNDTRRNNIRMLQTDNAVIRVEMINVVTQQSIKYNIKNGNKFKLQKFNLIDSSQLNLNVITGAATLSVQFDTSFQTKYLIESNKPYALCGDTNLIFNPCIKNNKNTLVLGDNTITITPFTAAGGKGTKGTPYQISFIIMAPKAPTAPKAPIAQQPIVQPIAQPIAQPIPVPQQTPVVAPATPVAIDSNIIERVELINIITKKVIDNDVKDNININIDDYNIPFINNITFVAITGIQTQSIIFDLNNNINFRTESIQPYTLCGDFDNTYFNCINLMNGNNVVKITPYTGVSGTGIAGPSRTINFKLISSTPIPAPTLQPVINPTQPSTFNELLINCGSNKLEKDTLNRDWLADVNFIGGSTFSSTSSSIANTNDDFIYQFERTGLSFSYAIPVPIGDYEINFVFAELVYTKVGDRVFNIIIENTITIDNIDIIDIANAPLTAVSISHVALVEDGILNIDFSKVGNSIGDPKISGIEVRLNAPHLAHAVAAGPYSGAILSDTTDKALIKLTGETTHTHGIGLEIDTVQWKEGNVVLGNTANLDYSFTVGIHDISLSTKDTGNNVDTDTTTVEIKPFGFPAIISLSPSEGSTLGNYEVLIQGSGFNHQASQITVKFGTVSLSGSSSITIIDSNNIKIIAPPTSLQVPILVSITTPLGTSNEFEFLYVGSTPIQWKEFVFYSFTKPTVGRFGPDQKLYVGSRQGSMLKLTMNSDFTATTNAVIVDIFPDHAILGIEFDPMETKAIPDVFMSVSALFHGGTLSTSGPTINGRIMKASGPSLETVTTIISGLPVADLDHALNAIVFGDYGELHFCSGSHTNGGIIGKISKSQLLKENFLSAAINVAYLSHPNFDGNVKWSAPDNGNLIAKGIDNFAVGVRNPYGLLMHSNLNLYATDNGPNKGYGKMMTGCGSNEFIEDQKRDDEFNHIVKDGYYGHPNPKRATYSNDPRQCIWHGPEDQSTTDYKAPLSSASSSRNGIVEFHSNHFDGQMRGNIIVGHHSKQPSLSRIILNADGTDVVPESTTFLPLNIGIAALDVTQAPNGNLIEMRFETSELAAQIPVEAVTNKLIVKTVFPRRGPNAGGNILSIYGVNFGANPIITVGNINCPYVSASSTSKRIDCVLPGGTGTVDIVVTIGVKKSTFAKGYRYISGLPPPGFILPIYPP